MLELQILVGLPGSGKSSYAQSKKNKYTIVSTDEIRATVFHDAEDQTHNPTVFKIAYERIRDALTEGKSVIFDATNISAKFRRELITFVRPMRPEVKAIVFCTPYKVCIERDAARERTVGEGVIMRMLRQFEAPHRYEGFDNIIFIQSVEKEDLVQHIKHVVPHDNPHHAETINEHLWRAEHLAEPYPAELWTAARFHDVGKFLTKDFHDAKGNATEIAHYYGHDNVSAYLFMTSPYFTPTAPLPLYLINFHMAYHNAQWKRLNWLKEYDPALVVLLEILTQIDNGASTPEENHEI